MVLVGMAAGAILRWLGDHTLTHKNKCLHLAVCDSVTADSSNYGAGWSQEEAWGKV